jgi:carbonic anhydrase
MQKLIDGLVHFQTHVFPERKALFEQLAHTQSPETLVITCSDSRVMLEMLLNVKPGELFICRNAGNIVPPHLDHSGGVSATIEYAVQVLKVKHIIVCGHSDCGAMTAVLHPEKVAHMPAVANWIAYAQRAREVAFENADGKSEAEMIRVIIEENVIAQLDNLRTHPFVWSKMRSGAIQLHGWVFNIKDGTVRRWSETSRTWEEIGLSAQRKAPATADAHEVGRV